MKLLTMKQVLEKVPYSRTHLKRLEDAGTFVRRMRPGNGPKAKVFYPEDEVEDWIAKNLARRG